MNFLKIFTPITIAIFLIIFDYKFSYLNNLRQSVATLISPIYMVVSLPEKLYTWINEQGTSKEQLLNDNQSLNNELLKLKVKLQHRDALALENKKLNTLLESSYGLQQASFTVARIESVSRSRLKKQIVINKGGNDNLKVGQVALGANGVLGQITQTTPTNASILIVSDPTQYIPIKNVRNGVQGMSQGIAEDKHQLLVRFIEPESDIKIDDIFVSSALGSKFPNGYPVGRVTDVEQRKNESFMHVTLEPMQQIYDLEFVIILDAL
ncbi:rod shape-determining protein MreC [Candidatus Thioglobus autotrophicus]|uniref:rod shape-determining protein MreC n=1 Tax=Candidatus Thioglobus autotrophicus TaxID=1705394 RepID=UPI00299CE361|nr:rod shape-determining protein MreC [Candidatus Thioglobus autotrophicus]WPE18412.1 rod shape-determining protein MreC [Candidatus Thioglobus autotrophicus]